LKNSIGRFGDPGDLLRRQEHSRSIEDIQERLQGLTSDDGVTQQALESHCRSLQQHLEHLHSTKHQELTEEVQTLELAMKDAKSLLLKIGDPGDLVRQQEFLETTRAIRESMNAAVQPVTDDIVTKRDLDLHAEALKNHLVTKEEHHSATNSMREEFKSLPFPQQVDTGEIEVLRRNVQDVKSLLAHVNCPADLVHHRELVELKQAIEERFHKILTDVVTREELDAIKTLVETPSDSIQPHNETVLQLKEELSRLSEQVLLHDKLKLDVEHCKSREQLTRADVESITNSVHGEMLKVTQGLQQDIQNLSDRQADDKVAKELEDVRTQLQSQRDVMQQLTEKVGTQDTDVSLGTAHEIMNPAVIQRLQAEFTDVKSQLDLVAHRTDNSAGAAVNMQQIADLMLAARQDEESEFKAQEKVCKRLDDVCNMIEALKHSSGAVEPDVESEGE